VTTKREVKYRHFKVRLYGNDLFNCVVLVLCAYGKIHWAWFWICFFMDMCLSSAKDMWGHEKD
jgi:hypothetical protein